MYIFTGPGLASCRRSRLNSNVRRRKLRYASHRSDFHESRRPPRIGTCAARLGSNHQTICERSQCILAKSRAEAANSALAYILQYQPSAPIIFFGLFHKGASRHRARRRAVSWLHVCRPSSRSARIQGPPFALVLRNAQNLRRWASRASAASVARKLMKSSSASSSAANCQKYTVAVVRPYRRLTRRSRRGPTASHQARATGTQYIICGPGLASCRRPRLTSNVRPHKTQNPRPAADLQSHQHRPERRLRGCSLSSSASCCFSKSSKVRACSTGRRRQLAAAWSSRAGRDITNASTLISIRPLSCFMDFRRCTSMS